MRLTPLQTRALELLEEKGPLISSDVGELLWPDRDFKSAQGAAFMGGGVMGRLSKKGFVKVTYHRSMGQLWPKGWVLTPKGRRAL